MQNILYAITVHNYHVCAVLTAPWKPRETWDIRIIGKIPVFFMWFLGITLLASVCVAKTHKKSAVCGNYPHFSIKPNHLLFFSSRVFFCVSILWPHQSYWQKMPWSHEWGDAGVGAAHRWYNGPSFSSDLLFTYTVQTIPVGLSFSNRVCGHRGTSHCNGTGQFIKCPVLWESYRLFHLFEHLHIKQRNPLWADSFFFFFLVLVVLGNQQSYSPRSVKCAGNYYMCILASANWLFLTILLPLHSCQLFTPQRRWAGS